MKIRIIIPTYNEKENIRELESFCSKFAGSPGERLFTCGAGSRQASVDAYGGLQMCLLLRNPNTVYDLNDGSIRDALTSFFPEIRRLKAESADYLSRCARCFLKALCEQCPAKSWMEHGCMDLPIEYYCKITHTQARFLGILADNEKAWELRNWENRMDELTWNQRSDGMDSGSVGVPVEVGRT